MNKACRKRVHDIFGGKCAYCGCELPERWHADNIEPIVRNWWNGTCNHPELDVESNYFPSCPSCNILKSSFGIEIFRKGIQGYVNSLNQYSTQYKMAKKFGLVQETNVEVKFYFETFTNG